VNQSIGTVYTVSDINSRIKRCVEPQFEDIWVTGEISNYKHHSSGHHYFTIKDGSSELGCALWRSSARGIKIRLRDGMEAVFNGDINVYEVRGRYQLIVKWVVEKGVGQLELQFRKLKERLTAEGLFESDRKLALPKFPGAIALVTSETGAAVQDMLNILRRRMPSVEIWLYPVKVQGDGAAEDIAGAIRDLNVMRGPDVMIVGRGGGSLEDLWAFNEEIVARAIAASDIPVISAVGHEVDFTIADFVADLRAPTPSAAAELAVPDAGELSGQVADMNRRLISGISSRLKVYRTHLRPMARSTIFRKPERIFQSQAQRLDELSSSLTTAAGRRVEALSNSLAVATEKIKALSPLAVLERGYAVCRRADDRTVLRSHDQVQIGDDVDVQLAHGEIAASVKARREV